MQRVLVFWPGCIFDIRVFNPLATSNRNTPHSSGYQRHEQEKRREYDQRIREIEHGPFAPLIFAVSNGMEPSTTITYKWFASLLASRSNHPYSTTMHAVAMLPTVFQPPIYN